MSLSLRTGDDTLLGDLSSLLDSFDVGNERSAGLSDMDDFLQGEMAPSTGFESRLAFMYSGKHQFQASSTNRKKRRYKRGYSTQLLARKKAEVIKLRLEVKGLEDWLQQHLKDTGGKEESSSSGPSCGDEQGRRHYWAAKSFDEFQKLQESRRVNQKLKGILANQVRLAKTLEEVLQKDLILDAVSGV